MQPHVKERGLLLAIAKMLTADHREDAINELVERGFFLPQHVDHIAKQFDSIFFTYRRQSESIAPVKYFIDDYLSTYTYSFFNQSRNVQTLRTRLSQSPSGLDVRGLRIVDYGAGLHRTFNQALTLLINGAEHVTVVEPAPLSFDIAKRNIIDFAGRILEDPSIANLGLVSHEQLKQNLCSVDFSVLSPEPFTSDRIRYIKNLDETFPEESADLVLSTSVLEHVKEPELELSLQKRALTETGHCVHTIDFTDHRTWAFDFYYDGHLGTCNGLRKSDFEIIASELGFSASWQDEKRSDEAINRANLVDRFADYGDDELSLKGATIVLSL
jgi:SAM-dependent methyltransferase